MWDGVNGVLSVTSFITGKYNILINYGHCRPDLFILSINVMYFLCKAYWLINRLKLPRPFWYIFACVYLIWVGNESQRNNLRKTKVHQNSEKKGVRGLNLIRINSVLDVAVRDSIQRGYLKRYSLYSCCLW